MICQGEWATFGMIITFMLQRDIFQVIWFDFLTFRKFGSVYAANAGRNHITCYGNHTGKLLHYQLLHLPDGKLSGVLQ